MAISFVQRKLTAFITAQGSLTVNFTNPIAAGSFIAVAGLFDDAAGVSTIITVQDGGGVNATIVISPFDVAGIPARIWGGFIAAPTAGTSSVTITYSGGNNPSYGDLAIWEIAGIPSPVADGRNHASGVGITADSGPTGTLAASNEAAISFGGCSSSYVGPATGNWTNLNIDPLGAMSEEQVLSSNASIDGTCTTDNSVDTWGILVLTFMTAPSLTPVPPKPEWPYGKEPVFPMSGRTHIGMPMQQPVVQRPQLMGQMVM